MTEPGQGTNDGQEGSQQQEQPREQPQGGQQQPTGLQAVANHMLANKVEAALWSTRMFTVVSTLLFLLPILGGNPYSFYQRALISNAATSALRLHQRLPNFQFSREYFGQLFLEDSAHYLFYSLIFLNNHPITLVLTPVFLFALMHATSYTKTLVNLIGPNSLMVIRNLIAKLELQQRNILRFIASCEIFMMPILVITLLMGQSFILLPFVYYRFLTLRYASRRNPYSRQIFYELRVTAEYLAAKPQCPAFLRNMTYKAIAFISRMAPQVAPQQ